MTQTEQILEYIDGVLDSDAEQGLFDAMARQPELRSALRQFIVIGDAVRADREAYTPPSHVERTLMAGLGIAPNAQVAGGMGLMARLSAFGGRYLGMILAFLLGALVAGGTVYMVTGSSETRVEMAGGTQPANSGSGAKGKVTDAGAAAGSKGVPQMGTGSTENSTGAGQSGQVNDGRPAQTQNARDRQLAEARSTTRTRAASTTSRQTRSSAMRADDAANGSGNDNGSGADGAALSSRHGFTTNTVPKSDAASETSNASGTVTPDITPVVVRSETSRRDQVPASTVEPSPQVLPDDFPSPVELKFDEPEKRNGILALELRRNFGGAFNPNQARRSTPGLDDYMIGAFIRPEGILSYGVEAGHESFDQTLYYADNDTLQVEQRPSFLWWGLTGRLNVAQLPFEGADAFVQGTLAFSTGGPVMRMRVGGEVPVFGGASLMAGLETAALMYNFRNQYSLSGRWGITTGLMWTF